MFTKTGKSSLFTLSYNDYKLKAGRISSNILRYSKAILLQVQNIRC